MAKMKIIREVTRAVYDKAKKSEMKDQFQFLITDERYYLIGGKKDLLILEK